MFNFVTKQIKIRFIDFKLTIFLYDRSQHGHPAYSRDLHFKKTPCRWSRAGFRLKHIGRACLRVRTADGYASLGPAVPAHKRKVRPCQKMYASTVKTVRDKIVLFQRAIVTMIQYYILNRFLYLKTNQLQ